MLNASNEVGHVRTAINTLRLPLSENILYYKFRT